MKPGHAFFISHGAGPFPLLGDRVHQPFLETMRNGPPIFDDSKGVFAFTAHWETDTPHVSGAHHPPLFYYYEDMRGILPKGAFEFSYPTNGHPQLAEEIIQHLNKSGFEAILDVDRGWDHGVYVPMAHLSPSWEITIVQMSIVQMSILKDSKTVDPTHRNFALGQAMATFRQQGYTIIASGSCSHDFKAIQNAFMFGQRIESDASMFEDKLKAAIEADDSVEREQGLMDRRQWPASEAARLHGHEDHFMPLLIVAGSADQDTAEDSGSGLLQELRSAVMYGEKRSVKAILTRGCFTCSTSLDVGVWLSAERKGASSCGHCYYH